MRKRHCAYRTRCILPFLGVPPEPYASHDERAPLARTRRLQQQAMSHPCVHYLHATQQFKFAFRHTIYLTRLTTLHPYSGHSNNKDAEINPTVLKKRKLSEAISS
ncbi:unnamed protein product [Colias eurytheme]|nr:unnamed protein product [Colias eurytheme]